MQDQIVRHIFCCGAKSIGMYGGYETFIDRLIGEHEKEALIKYHIACKANVKGFMDESKLSNIKVLKREKNGNIAEFEYKNAHIFKIDCPNIGPAVAIYYDWKAVRYSIKYCVEHNIKSPVFYIMTCRIGLFIKGLSKKIKALGGKFYLNPDGRESLRQLYSPLVRKYWAYSEKMMVRYADLVICDSINIEKHIRDSYGKSQTTYIAYGADVIKSRLDDNDPKYTGWINTNNISQNDYYLIVGRFVPENNFEIMIHEFMKSDTSKKLVIITNTNQKFLNFLEDKLHFSSDERIKFVGTLYDKELLKKIRENAYCYLHGHEVGGTNPSLLEALGSTRLNLLLDVGFNHEVGLDSALYWTKDCGSLKNLINYADNLDVSEIEQYGKLAKKRIENSYSWQFIGEQYKKLWLSCINKT